MTEPNRPRPTDRQRLPDVIEGQVRRMIQADKERRTVLKQTVFLGTLGLVFILPIVVGAYLGEWLDEAMPGYSMRWTLSLIVLGLGVGAMNVYLLFRDSEDGQ